MELHRNQIVLIRLFYVTLRWWYEKQSVWQNWWRPHLRKCSWNAPAWGWFQPISFDWNTSFLHLNPECRHILWFSRHQQKQKAKSMFSCWKAKNKLVILCNCKPKKELARGKGKDGVFYAVLKLSFSIFCNWSAFIRRSILLCLGITRRFFTLLTSALSKQIKQWQIFWNTHKHMQKIQ